MRVRFIENDFDTSIQCVVISGNRCREFEGKHSNLNVVVEFSVMKERMIYSISFMWMTSLLGE
jgi:hypothetical protein